MLDLWMKRTKLKLKWWYVIDKISFQWSKSKQNKKKVKEESSSNLFSFVWLWNCELNDDEINRRPTPKYLSNNNLCVCVPVKEVLYCFPSQIIFILIITMRDGCRHCRNSFFLGITAAVSNNILFKKKQWTIRHLKFFLI